ncbi:MAG: HAD-IIB family hydrolase [Clostridia bacterium]|nr:HAD-IIB family hydrolase [Clostridia bacterium]
MTNRFYNLLILSDLDGTFFGRGASLVPRNLEAVERFQRRGGLFTFSTGRTHSNLYTAVPHPEKIVNAPMSLGNGACLYDAAQNRAIVNYLLDPAAGLEAAHYIRKNYPFFGLRISTTEGFMTDPDDEVAIRNLRHVAPDSIILVPENEWTADNWYKLVMIGSEERIAQIRPECEQYFSGRLVGDKSGKNLFELHRPDRTKATMIDTFRELYAKEGRELTVCAVGDYENDRDVLRAADIAVCPSNATDEIKQICDLCLCSNNEGVIADIVEYFENNYNEKWGKQ